MKALRIHIAHATVLPFGACRESLEGVMHFCTARNFLLRLQTVTRVVLLEVFYFGAKKP